MINPGIFSIKRTAKLPALLRQVLALLMIASQSMAANPPVELTGVIEHFLTMESTSLEIQQVIDWRFSNDNDSLKFQMDINADNNFRLTLAGFGMEIFVSDTEMVTINHTRQQILYENATPDALLKQLFVGGDFRRLQKCDLETHV